LRNESDRSGRAFREIVAAAKPPLHFSRRDALIAAGPRWTLPAIGKAMERLDQSAFECRANASLGPAAASAALLAVSLLVRQRAL
jgi:hypothetical protein